MQSGFEERQVFGFIKYHPLEYLIELQNGLLYCNPIQEFAKLAPIDGRGDKYEYVVKQTFGESAILELANGDLNITHIEGIRVKPYYCIYNYYNKNFFANLFCLYALTPKQKSSIHKYELSDQIRAMGDYTMIINHPIEFLNRVKNALEKENILYHMDFIEYMDLYNLEGKKSYFQKPLRYSYQEEFRIMIKNDCEKVFKLDIGSIRDISAIYPTEHLKRVKILLY